jgi:hypothetical protein
VVEDDQTVALSLSNGAVMVWFQPLWNSGDRVGTAGRLLEIGSYTTNASVGWWGLYLVGTTNIGFGSQDGLGHGSNYLSAPISWSSNQWHFIAVTYSSSNSALYLDGTLATNGPGIAYLPGTSVVAGGFFIGSDSNGLNQAAGRFDDLSTFDYQLSAYGIAKNYELYAYLPDSSLLRLTNGPSYSTNFPGGSGLDVVGGPGSLHFVTNLSSGCIESTSVWLTNVSAILTSTGTVTVQFVIAGGSNGWPYDVFATTALVGPDLTNSVWSWHGQAYQCNSYTLSNLPKTSVYLILGQPTDSDKDGLTDAYELLVSKTSPTNAYSLDSVIPDGWFVLNGIDLVNWTALALEDPDHDALINRQEYLYGTNPRVSEGFGIWVSSPAGFLSIP